MATLPIGFSDGYPYQVADKKEVIIHGRRYPIIAAVTTDYATVNITGSNGIKNGDVVVLIGKQGNCELTAEEVGNWAGIYVYKNGIGMKPLVSRISIGEE